MVIRPEVAALATWCSASHTCQFFHNNDDNNPLIFIQEYSMDAQDERLRFQMARILDVNQHLNALIESSEKGFPMHMNLAVQPPPYEVHQNSIVQRLKEQNHLLTEEVSRKSEVIAQLEREKATLIRELFQARSKNRGHANETTLM